MDFKKFVEGLTPEQRDVAIEIGDRAQKMGINPDFVLPMIKGESTFNHNALGPETKSGERAIGVMQLMPSTAKALGVDPEDPKQNIEGGLRLIKQLMENKKIGNDPYKLIVGYNQNPTAKFLDTGDIRDLPEETRNHMIRVSDFYGGNLPKVSFGNGQEKQETEVAQAPNQSEAETKRLDAQAQAAGPRYIENQQSPFQAGILGGAIGSSLGGGAATLNAGYKALEGLAKTGASAIPSVINAVTPSQPVAQTMQVASDGSLVPTDEQHERAFQGTTKEKGITGRASQTTYNLRTQQIAEEARKQKETMERLKKLGIMTGEMKPLSEMGSVASTPSGIIAPTKAVEGFNAAEAAKVAPPPIPSRSPLSYLSKLLSYPVKGGLGLFTLGAGLQDINNRMDMGANGEALASGLGTTAGALSPFVSGALGTALGGVGMAVPLGLAVQDRQRELIAHPERFKEPEKDRGYYVDPMGGSVFVGQ